MTIAYYIASPTWGGGEQYVFNLAQQLIQQRLVKCLFLFPAHANQQMVDRFRQLGECPTFSYNSKLWRFSPLAGYRLACLLQHYQVDILHLNSRQSYGIAGWAKRFIHRPLRVMATQHLVREAKNTPMWRLIYRQLDTLICVSRCVLNTYLRPWGSVAQSPFRHVEVVLNSVAITQPEQLCQQHTDCPIFFYHGRICEEKGVIPMLHRLEKIQDLTYRACMAGTVDPRYEDKWNKALMNSPIRDRIEILGFRTDMPQLILKAHIGLIPSLAPESGGPLALLEDMALGMPVIASNNGAQPEYITSMHNGILCPPADDEAWINAMRTLLTDVSLRQQLGRQAAKDLNNRYSFAQYIQTMQSVYSL